MFGFSKQRYQAWAVKQAGNPKYLVIAAVGFSASLILGYHFIYKPSARRKALTEAEEYAKMLYERETTQH